MVHPLQTQTTVGKFGTALVYKLVVMMAREQSSLQTVPIDCRDLIEGMLDDSATYTNHIGTGRSNFREFQVCCSEHDFGDC